MQLVRTLTQTALVQRTRNWFRREMGILSLKWDALNVALDYHDREANRRKAERRRMSWKTMR